MSNSGIYKITSPSWKIYIGETINFQKRFLRYKGLQCKKQYKLYNSFLKYGVENHIFEIIEECEVDDLKCRERYWQDEYDVLSDNGMNLTLTSCGDKKMIHSDESKIKIYNTKKDRGQFLPENNPMYGKKHSQETINKISIAIGDRYEGDKNPMYGKFGKDHPAFGTKRDVKYLEKRKGLHKYGKNPNSKIVIDMETGIFYESASEIADLLNINKYTFRARLNGSLINNTNFKYC